MWCKDGNARHRGLVAAIQAIPIMAFIAKCCEARVPNATVPFLFIPPRIVILIDVSRERRCLRIRSEKDGAAGAFLSVLASVAPETTIHAGTTASTASQSLLLHPTAPTLAIVYTAGHSLDIAFALSATFGLPSHTSPPEPVVRSLLVVHSLTRPRLERHHTTPRHPQRWGSATFRRYAQRRRYHCARWWASRRSTVARAYKQTATRGRLRSQTRSSSRRRTTSCISWP
jgi:hypothetical protein